MTRFFRVEIERVKTSMHNQSRINLWERDSRARKNGGRTRDAGRRRRDYFLQFHIADDFGGFFFQQFRCVRQSVFEGEIRRDELVHFLDALG